MFSTETPMPKLHESALSSSSRLLGLLGLAGLVLPTALLAGCDSDEIVDDELPELVMRAAPVSECVSFEASGDAMISNPPKNNNYGAHPLLRVGGKDESLLSFDLSSIPEGSTVDSATLRLYVNGSAGNNPVNIHAATSAWSEATVTYQSFNQQFAAAISGAIDPQSANALKSADVSGLVTSWLTGAQPNLGMLLEAAGNKKNIFVSSDGAAAYAPSLEVCYTVPPTDYCADDPCQNGGICINGDDDYTCECAPGYEGTNCETEIDECAANPCVFGTCTDEVAGYSCACDAGYEGNNCDLDIDECAPNPCQNGAICTDGIDSFSCDCDAGYSGTLCEVDIDECAGDPCQNGGVCTDGVADYSCACPAGYEGANCEIDIDDCVGALCENGSACVDGVDEYTCSCLPGFEGVFCETNIDDCAGDPCLNGGVCTDGVSSYSCECAPGYSGDQCEVDIDDCVANTCVNGSCVDQVNAFSCVCDPGWTGANCDEVPGICDANPCANGGECIENADGSSFTCVCASGFTGPDCTTPYDACGGEVEDLGSTVPQSVLGISLEGLNDDLDSACSNAGGPDRAYTFTAPAAGGYRFDTQGSGGDPVLAILNDCGGPELACNDDTVALQSQLDIVMEAGETVTIFLDSYNVPPPGTLYQLNVSEVVIDESVCGCFGDALFANFVAPILASPIACSADGNSFTGLNFIGALDRLFLPEIFGRTFCQSDFITQAVGARRVLLSDTQADSCRDLFAQTASNAGLVCE